VQKGVNVYSDTLMVPTAATLLSAAPQTAADARAVNAATLAAAAGGNVNATAAVNGAAGLGLAADAGFTIDQALTTSVPFIVQTNGSRITVSSAITVDGNGQLGLISGNELAINAPITITGGGKVALNAVTSTSLDGATRLLWLSFAQGASISYAETAPGSGVGIAGQALTINGDSYNLIYSIAGIQALDFTAGRRDALALSLTATGTYGGYLANQYQGTFDGLGNTISDLKINAANGASIINLLFTGGVLRNIGLAGDTVYTNKVGYAGSFVGQNEGIVQNVFSNARITAFAGGGGIVGSNFSSGVVVGAYFTGSVSGSSYVGGIAATNDGLIAQVFSAGSIAGNNTFAGGLVGLNDGFLSLSYSSGRVVTTRVNGSGGLAGVNDTPGNIINSYWDTETSGQATSDRSSSQNAATYGLTTADFQNGGASELAPAFTGFSGGTGGLYPYLKSFFPNGVKAISGTAYTDAGVTPAASGAGGAVTVTGLIDGATFGSATTGANGYYYIFGAPTVGDQVVVSSNGSTGGATFQQNASFTSS
jgi:hypothetical protein